MSDLGSTISDSGGFTSAGNSHFRTCDLTCLFRSAVQHVKGRCGVWISVEHYVDTGSRAVFVHVLSRRKVCARDVLWKLLRELFSNRLSCCIRAWASDNHGGRRDFTFTKVLRDYLLASGRILSPPANTFTVSVTMPTGPVTWTGAASVVRSSTQMHERARHVAS